MLWFAELSSYLRIACQSLQDAGLLRSRLTFGAAAKVLGVRQGAEALVCHLAFTADAMLSLQVATVHQMIEEALAEMLAR